MNQYYAVHKETQQVEYRSASLFLLKDIVKFNHKDINDYLILEDVGMKYVSRIVYVDGECIYNNVEFWRERSRSILEEYGEHDVTDMLGNPVDQLRYETEMNSNMSRISCIDGRPGEVEYNIEVGNEFIALFREECILTDFTTVTPIEIAQKLSQVILLVQTGSFREAKMVLATVERDSFLTEERITKYVNMLDAADSIEYATSEEFYYQTSSENDETV